MYIINTMSKKLGISSYTVLILAGVTFNIVCSCQFVTATICENQTGKSNKIITDARTCDLDCVIRDVRFGHPYHMAISNPILSLLCRNMWVCNEKVTHITILYHLIFFITV